MREDVIDYLPIFRATPGWFAFTDLLVFDALLDAQSAAAVSGDLLEIGVMHGKSAFFLGRKCRSGETLLLCDLFEDQPEDDANAREKARSYPGVTRARFDCSARELSATTPRVLQMNSANLGEHIAAGTLRFAHVDGGHLYREVLADVELVHSLVREGDGWVAFDDYRTAHAPGVAAAVWPALARGPLKPQVLTSTKLYASESPSETTKSYLRDQLVSYGLELEEQQIFGHGVLRVVEPLETAPYQRPTGWGGVTVVSRPPVASHYLRRVSRRLINSRRSRSTSA